MTLGDHFDIEREEGRQEGQRIFIFELLKEKGIVSSELRDYINQVSDPAELSRIHKLASKASSIEEFEKAAELVIQ